MTNANLMHGMLSGKAVTFLSRLQPTGNVRSNLPQKLQRMDLNFLHAEPVLSKSLIINNTFDKTDYTWGDHDAMINIATILDAKLHKRQNILSIHFVRSKYDCIWIH
ncbi:hypothetical protein FRACYDRAFT_242553 [Fragilariopsis cylindrus CCMP1102]|uniref:Uncharacterized protein n=1 Tax=Fragilariopsis cylindrus CCMP1102 TaxID=635003 RepID=A0A1E7F548_9STRA|nr:hypothetical protein FRACYDRAFT_242553 [Fragilariopsis cylindrus CCMP1102]|eukprot:OEU13125.1 hypothetical protein FRACYDRAFT_242553 [Fragilariopsis cylindrus CCMP1102]